MLASTKAVYVLAPLPLETQIQDLLAGHRVEEALVLTEGAQRNIPKDKFQVIKTTIYPTSHQIVQIKQTCLILPKCA